MVWKKKPRSRDPLEVRKVVFSACDKMRKVGLKELEGYSDSDQWLMFGRIVNIMFQRHYKLSMDAAEEAFHQAENKNEKS